MWGGGGHDEARSVAVSRDGYVYVTGSTRSFSAEDDLLLMKFDWRGLLVWNRTLDDGTQYGFESTDRGNHVVLSDDGYIYVIGEVACGKVSESHRIAPGILLAKYDSSGNLVWFISPPYVHDRFYWVTHGEQWLSGAVDENGDIYIAGGLEMGEYWQTGHGLVDVDALLVKCSSDGEILWRRNWGTSLYDPYGLGWTATPVLDLATSVAISADSYVYVAGYLGRFLNDKPDLNAFLAKYDMSGEQIWNRTYGGTLDDVAYAVCTADGATYVAGSTSSYGAGSQDTFLLKYDTDGNQVWNRTWGGPESETVNSLSISMKNELYLCGEASSFSTDGSAGTPRAFINEYDTSGNMIMSGIWGGGSRGQSAESVAISDSGDVYFTGTVFGTEDGDSDVFLVKNLNGVQYLTYQFQAAEYVLLAIAVDVAAVFVFCIFLLTSQRARKPIKRRQG